jgi:hypothetical protein
MTGWDGTTERRTPMLLAEELRPKQTVEVPIVMVLVGFAAVLLLQVAAIWSHGTIIHNQGRLLDNEDRFTCFVVRTTQGAAPADVLTECRFLNVGGRR